MLEALVWFCLGALCGAFRPRYVHEGVERMKAFFQKWTTGAHPPPTPKPPTDTTPNP
jgi:hypothetical protein